MTEIYSGRNQKSKAQSSTAAEDEDVEWWETAEDHRFALEVLQLKLRRDILKIIRQCPQTEEEIAKKFALDEWLAEYHLALLEKALVIERRGPFYQLTSTGALYLNNVEERN